jgi:hypothetical protein
MSMWEGCMPWMSLAQRLAVLLASRDAGGIRRCGESGLLFEGEHGTGIIVYQAGRPRLFLGLRLSGLDDQIRVRDSVCRADQPDGLGNTLFELNVRFK